MKHIRTANEADREAVHRLKASEYARSSEFRVTSTFVPKVADPLLGVFAAVDGADVLSTMQGTIVADLRGVESLLECSVKAPSIEFPALVLTRAATVQGLRSRGLNSALRFYFLTAAEQQGVGCVLGLVYAGAPRLGLMERLGYRFSSASSWEVGISTERRRLLAVLEGARIASAASLLRELAGEAIEEYLWVGPAFDLVRLPDLALQRTPPAATDTVLSSHPSAVRSPELIR